MWFTESRDENFTGWVSGYTAYVVGADPDQKPAAIIKITKVNPATENTPVPAGVVGVIGWPTASTGQTALNIGSNVKRANGEATVDGTNASATPPEAQFYMKPYVQSSMTASATNPTARWYGPSSAHSGGVVLHGFADGHGKSIPDNIDRNIYLRIISRAGGEVVDTSSGGGFWLSCCNLA